MPTVTEPETTDAARSTARREEYCAELVVESKESAADDVVAVTLVHPAHEALPAWSPGSHIDLVTPSNRTRQYSLCGDTGDRRRWRIGVLRTRDSRGGSRYVHDDLRVGTRVRVRGPRNHFRLLDGPRYLFIAGGIGITPLLPMIVAADTRHADWTLRYAGRSLSSMAFVDELTRYGQRVHLHPDDDNPLPLTRLLAEPRPDTQVYCCGPAGMLEAIETAAASWPPGSLRYERFSPKKAPATQGPDCPFEVVCRRSGVTLTVPPGRSILETAREAGLEVLSSCREGTCGTCEQEVLEGRPDHRDSVLTPEEQASNETMMICVSRSRDPRLVLDL